MFYKFVVNLCCKTYLSGLNLHPALKKVQPQD